MHALEQLLNDAIGEVDAANDLIRLDQVRVDYLGRKGMLTQQLKQLEIVCPPKLRMEILWSLKEGLLLNREKRL